MSNDDSLGKQWMVLLEAADERARTTIDAAAFRRLVTAWAAAPPGVLYSPSRYALQVAVVAQEPQSALAAAMGLWSDALRRAGLPRWQLVRAEVVTPDEFERDLQAEDWDGAAAAPVLGRHPSGADPTSDDLLRRALHDPVTGLAGRELFLDHVRAAVGASHPGSAPQAVMVVDLDGLDPPASEEVLVEVAGRLKDAVRRADVVARVGRARFAVLVTVASGEDTAVVADRIVGNVRSPILGDGPALAVTASVGVARTSPGADADDLLGMAEVAMAAAKKAGGDRHRRFPARSDSI